MEAIAYLAVLAARRHLATVAADLVSLTPSAQFLAESGRGVNGSGRRLTSLAACVVCGRRRFSDTLIDLVSKLVHGIGSGRRAGSSER